MRLISLAILLPGAKAILTSIVGLCAVLIWRVRETRGAVSLKKIVMPPLGMATGLSMFATPSFRVPWSWAAIALFAGAVALAYPLLRTSRLICEGDVMMMQRSRTFFAMIVALAAIRRAARGYLDSLLTLQQTAALFYLLAFGMIVRWRAQMLIEYRNLTSEIAATAAP